MFKGFIKPVLKSVTRDTSRAAMVAIVSLGIFKVGERVYEHIAPKDPEQPPSPPTSGPT